MKVDFSEFREMIQGLFDPQFNFDYTNVESWTSMQTLIVVSSLDEHYDVLLSHEELKKAKKLEDLYAILLQKIN